MKKLMLLFAVVLFTSCQIGTFVYYDDIYTSTRDEQYRRPIPVENTNTYTEAQNYNSYPNDTQNNYNDNSSEYYYEGNSGYNDEGYSESYYDENGNTYVTNNYYYDSDDYYDYYYTSRIRRFHTNVYDGWSYYDPYFTNMYWYDYSPASWGCSIYLGYNWWWLHTSFSFLKAKSFSL